MELKIPVMRSLKLILAGLVLAAAALAAPAGAQTVNTGHIEAELAPLYATAEPGSTIYVALRQTLAPGWHTYWKNAGDAGQPPEIAWKLPDGWKAGEAVWPLPKRLPQAPLMTYGYEGQVFLPVPITVPASAKPGDRALLSAHVDFLVCKDVCIPESANLSLSVPIASGKPELDPRFGPEIARALAAAPKPGPITARFVFSKGVITLAAVGAPLKGADMSGAYFFPSDASSVSLPARQAVRHGPDGVTLTLTPSPAVAKTGALAGPLSGVLATKAGAWEISANAGLLPPGAAGLGDVAAAGDAPKAARGGVDAFAVAVLFALAGGLILNLMPCVFPVLSMKAAALAARAHAPGEAKRDGLFFLAGVLATFLALAVVLIAAKAAGHAAGWGFQLQSPPVVAALALLTLAIAMNLSGVFEAGLSLQGVGASLQHRSGAAGAFFTGVLAVVVGAPCTAPFMASALGYALTASWAATLAVFLALGIGLAAPFTALCFAPGLLRRLPKPGPWMDALRKLLAFPMYATAAFMAWVFSQQDGGEALGLLLGAGVALGLCLHLFGRHQHGHAEGRRGLGDLIGASAALVLAIVLAVSGMVSPSTANTAVASGGALHAQPYSEARLAALRAEGKPVFVNFTAAWCVTCKVNEEVAFSSRDTARAFAETGAVYLVGDWTGPNAEISAALAAHGRPGVPLYLVYGAGGGEPQVLPQVLTPGVVIHALKVAAGKA